MFSVQVHLFWEYSTMVLLLSEDFWAQNITFEAATDTAQSPRNTFRVFDEKNLYYDFRLKKGSGAIDSGSPLWALPTDRRGVARDAKPDLGAYEYVE